MLSPTKTKKLFLLLTILAAFFILAPNLFYQNQFAQGDHGRDLYAFSMSADGKLPYKDYQWVYGPLMPFYYAFFFKIFGESVATVLFAETILKFLSGILFFFIMYLFTTPFWSFLSAVFFLSNFSFFPHTYNHVGGVVCLLFIGYMLLRYITTQKYEHLMWGLLGIGLLSLIKLNFGIVILYVYVICVALIDIILRLAQPRKMLFYISALIILPAAIYLIHFLMTAGLPDYVLRQCFPYSEVYRQQSIHLSLALPIFYYFIQLTTANNEHHMVIFWLFMASLIAFPWAVQKIREPQRKKVLVSALCIAMLTVASLHEFFPTGIVYRLLWGVPYFLCLTLLFLGIAHFHLSKVIRVLIATLIFVTAFSQMNVRLNTIQDKLSPEHFLSHKRGGIFIGNEPVWLETVDATLSLLNDNLKEDELFFAFPYEPLYYFFMDRPSPTYPLVIFNYMNIPPEQDQQIIADLQRAGVNWVIFSNRIAGYGKNLGQFGITHSVDLAKYLNENFEMKWEVGNWAWDADDPPDWWDKHGIRVLKRK